MNVEVEKIRYGCGDCQTRQMVGEICEKCGKHYCPEHLECVAACCPVVADTPPEYAQPAVVEDRLTTEGDSDVM